MADGDIAAGLPAMAAALGDKGSSAGFGLVQAGSGGPNGLFSWKDTPRDARMEAARE
eukprot:CAMPEP_0202889130 /NCGR_PEP_ID=MMETSP1391-20130828/43545_1 /ASSEMBLY_ACC=CAM_ASM_000867 /TAXON_ID=1034604 /ORGANISM="Chlamydomonas leiostraca, Strain SAG 11-49" /LENGTH=56 /DNA_ID=CAMNT_0049572451 /DNA_START=1407 /DNA_END=1577 /DNA_ORIENTATION=+